MPRPAPGSSSWLAALVAAAVLWTPGPAAAQADDPAAAAAAEARDHFNARRYREAIAAYGKAYDASRDPKYVFNIARIHELVNDQPEALMAYERYVRVNPLAPDRAKVEAAVERLRALVSKTRSLVHVEATPAGTAIYLDRRTDDRRRVDEAYEWLLFGTHHVFGEKPGYVTVERTIEVVPGPPLQVTLVLVAARSAGSLTVSSNVSGARVYVDGELVGTAPTGALEREAGRHQLRVTAPGHVDWEEDVPVNAGVVTPIHATLQPAPAVIGPPIEPPPPPVATRWIGWTLLGTGAALGAAALGVHLDALSLAGELDELAKKSALTGEESREFDASSARVEAERPWVPALYAASGALVVGAALWLLLDSDEPTTRATLTPAAGWMPNGGWLGAEARF